MKYKKNSIKNSIWYSEMWHYMLWCGKLVITTEISGSDKYQQVVSVVWGWVSESMMGATVVVLQSQGSSEPGGLWSQINTKKCEGSNGEISFNVKSNVNGGQLEVKLTRKGLGRIATDRFEVRQRDKNELVIRFAKWKWVEEHIALVKHRNVNCMTLEREE